jgi:hypothetical protein
MAAKSFKVQAPGINGIKPFAAVIYKFSKYAREFVPGMPLQLG